MASHATIELGAYPWWLRAIGIPVLGFFCFWSWVCVTGQTISVGSHRHGGTVTNRPATMADDAVAIPALLMGGLLVGIHYRKRLAGEERRIVTEYGWAWIRRQAVTDIAGWGSIVVGPLETRTSRSKNGSTSYRVTPVRGVGPGLQPLELDAFSSLTDAQACAQRVADATGLPVENRT
jgi:hypothetical protein